MRDESTKRTLREAHREHTRDLIIEGLIKVMAEGVVTWSVPDVARAAGVSVPTVYRYFRTKDELIQGLGAFVARKIGFTAAGPPQSPRELADLVRQMFISADEAGEALRLAAVSELARDVRQQAMPVRLRLIEGALAPVRDRFAPDDWERLVRIVLVLASTAMLRALQEYLGLSGAPAADVVTWAILRLCGEDDAANDKTDERPH
jgi:AcrR family transcriptional regulator